jgi:hypothetical protein
MNRGPIKKITIQPNGLTFEANNISGYKIEKVDDNCYYYIRNNDLLYEIMNCPVVIEREVIS